MPHPLGYLSFCQCDQPPKYDDGLFIFVSWGGAWALRNEITFSNAAVFNWCKAEAACDFQLAVCWSSGFLWMDGPQILHDPLEWYASDWKSPWQRVPKNISWNFETRFVWKLWGGKTAIAGAAGLTDHLLVLSYSSYLNSMGHPAWKSRFHSHLPYLRCTSILSSVDCSDFLAGGSIPGHAYLLTTLILIIQQQ